MGFFNNMYQKIRKMLGIQPKALPELTKSELLNEINIPEEIKPEEPKAANKFREQLVETEKTFTPEIMPRSEAIIEILKQQGMKEELAKNEDAVKEILDIVHEKIDVGDKETRITSQNLEEVSAKLSGLIENGIIVVSKEGNYDRNVQAGFLSGIYTERKSIDVNEKGKTVVSKSLKQKETVYDGVTSYDTNSFIEDIITLEDGIEMEKEHNYSSSTFNHKTCRREDVIDNGFKITRGPDLVTAYVSFYDKMLPSYRNSCGGRIIVDGGGVPERLSYGLGFETDVNTILEARQSGKTPNGFEYEGEDPEIKQQNEEYKKNLLRGRIKESKAFERLAVKRGLIEAPTQEATQGQ